MNKYVQFFFLFKEMLVIQARDLVYNVRQSLMTYTKSRRFIKLTGDGFVRTHIKTCQIHLYKNTHRCNINYQSFLSKAFKIHKLSSQYDN